MYFIKLENNQPVGNKILEANFRRLFPNIILPRTITAKDISNLGFGIYKIKNAPVASLYQKVQYNGLVLNETGEWEESWLLADMTVEEKTEVDAKEVERVRRTRDEFLSSSDWTQVADAPVDKAAWATYRQLLRDITTQTGFPWSVSFPVKPE